MSEPSEQKTPDSAAAAWDARLRQPGASARTRFAFDLWRRERAENGEAWDLLQNGLSALRAHADQPELQALREEARLGARRARGRVWAAAAGLAASVLLLAGAGLTAGSGAGLRSELAALVQGGKVYRTALNERTKVALADGSLVTLDANSHLVATLSGERRELALLRGRALFEVAKDPSRPFVVRAGDRTVTALGTVFDVRLGAEGRVKVTLVEGKVAVRPARDQAGRQSEVQVLEPRQQFIELAAAPPQVVSVEPGKALSWTEGQLFFEDEPLSAAVAEMNRYSRAKIVIVDPAIADLRINGMFRAGNQTGFVGALQATLPVDVRLDDEKRILISGRARAGGAL